MMVFHLLAIGVYLNLYAVEGLNLKAECHEKFNSEMWEMICGNSPVCASTYRPERVICNSAGVSIDLSDCELDDVPSYLLRNDTGPLIVSLNLAHNKLKKLTEEGFVNLTNLRYLNLSRIFGNYSHKVIPISAFAGLDSLKYLALGLRGGNSVSRFDQVSGLDNLEALFITGTGGLSSEVQNLAMLRILSLGTESMGPGCKICLKDFTNMNRLERLSVRNCATICTYHSSSHPLPSSLQYLDVSSKHIDVKDISAELPQSLRVFIADNAMLPKHSSWQLQNNLLRHNLTALSLDGYNTNFNSLQWGSVLFPSLKRLSVARNYIKPYQQFINSIKGFVNLKYLDISRTTSSWTTGSGSPNVTIHPWFLSEDLHVLPSDVSDSNNTIIASSSFLPNLQELIARGNFQIPFANLKFATELRSLDLSGINLNILNTKPNCKETYGFDQLEFLQCKGCQLPSDSFGCWTFWFPTAKYVDFSSSTLHLDLIGSFNNRNLWKSLNLSSVKKTEFHLDVRELYPHLEEIILSNMKIKSTNISLPTNLTTVDLSDNPDLIIEGYMRQDFDAHYLRNANFTLNLNKSDGEKCSCDLLEYLKWLQHSLYISYNSNCSNQISNLTVSQYLSQGECQTPSTNDNDAQIVGKAVGISFGLLAVIIIAFVLIKRNYWTIKIYLHRTFYAVLCCRRQKKVNAYIPNSMFISFCKHDRDQENLVHALYEYLKRKQLNLVLLSTLDILPGEKYYERIIQMIEQCEYIVPLISSAVYFAHEDVEYQLMCAIELRELSAIHCIINESEVLDGFKNPVMTERLLENALYLYPPDTSEESLMELLGQLQNLLYSDDINGITMSYTPSFSNDKVHIHV